VKRGNTLVPLVAESSTGGNPVLVGTYPALLTRSEAVKLHQLGLSAEDAVVLLPDYLVEQDLPSAYQELLRQQSGGRY